MWCFWIQTVLPFHVHPAERLTEQLLINANEKCSDNKQTSCEGQLCYGLCAHWHFLTYSQSLFEAFIHAISWQSWSNISLKGVRGSKNDIDVTVSCKLCELEERVTTKTRILEQVTMV